MSSVKTSGRRLRILSRATKGSGAVPTTSISGSDARASASILRTIAESSTISTRILRPASILKTSAILEPSASGDGGLWRRQQADRYREQAFGNHEAAMQRAAGGPFLPRRQLGRP